MLPPSGMPPITNEACCTPGVALMRSTISWNFALLSAGGWPGSVRGNTCAVSTLVGSKPGSIRISVTKLPMKSAAPTSSTTASATSATTSALRKRCRAVPTVPRAPSFNACVRSGFDNCSAGTMPVRMPVAIAATAATASTRRSMRDGADASHAVRHRAPQHLHAPPREHDGEQRPKTGEHHVLHQQLTNQPPASRTQCGPHAHFALARGRARQLQRGHVHARNQQDEPDRAEQHQHPRLRARADDVIDQRARANQRVLVPLRDALPAARRQSDPSAPRACAIVAPGFSRPTTCR